MSENLSRKGGPGEQTTIPVPSVAETTQPCSWCGKPSSTRICIVPDRFGTVKGKRILKKRGTYAPACPEHARSLKKGKPIEDGLKQDWTDLPPHTRYGGYNPQGGSA